MAETLAETGAQIQGESLGDRAKRLSANRASAATANAEAAGKYGSTAGKDLGAKEKDSAGLPKQGDYGSTAEWAAAMRKYREAQGSTPQARALGGMIKGGG